MPSYKVFKNNRLVTTVPGVLAPITLAGIETVNGSNVITHTALSGSNAVYPGMSVRIPGIPPGSFIGAIKDSTHLELLCGAWNATTGVYSISATNAQATSAGTISGLSGMALGYDPLCIIAPTFLLGTWRNELESNTFTIPTIVPWAASSGNTSGATVAGNGAIVSNSEVTGATVNYATTGVTTVTPTYGIKSDSLAATPLKRHNGEPWGLRLLFSTGGAMSHFPATPEWLIHYSSAT